MPHPSFPPHSPCVTGAKPPTARHHLTQTHSVSRTNKETLNKAVVAQIHLIKRQWHNRHRDPQALATPVHAAIHSVATNIPESSIKKLATLDAGQTKQGPATFSTSMLGCLAQAAACPAMQVSAKHGSFHVVALMPRCPAAYR